MQLLRVATGMHFFSRMALGREFYKSERIGRPENLTHSTQYHCHGIVCSVGKRGRQGQTNFNMFGVHKGATAFWGGGAPG